MLGVLAFTYNIYNMIVTFICMYVYIIKVNVNKII